MSSNSKGISELYGISTEAHVDWQTIISNQQCPFLNRRCVKSRKSEASQTIGTCSVKYGSSGDVMICPHRLIERRQIFMDCMHLLTKHEPGNEIHLVSELNVPGGNVDYILVSARDGKVKDFVGIELQTLDTTGTVWNERERFLKKHSMPYSEENASSKKTYGLNWKMTAKTILVQLHHKVKTFEHVNKNLVLVIQDPLLAYMEKEFNFGHVEKNAKIGDPLHFHSYAMKQKADNNLYLSLTSRYSTDTEGVNICLGLQAEAKVELLDIMAKIESKMSEKTLMTI